MHAIESDWLTEYGHSACLSAIHTFLSNSAMTPSLPLCLTHRIRAETESETWASNATNYYVFKKAQHTGHVHSLIPPAHFLCPCHLCTLRAKIEYTRNYL